MKCPLIGRIEIDGRTQRCAYMLEAGAEVEVGAVRADIEVEAAAMKVIVTVGIHPVARSKSEKECRFI